MPTPTVRGSFGAAVTLALLGLCPNVILSTAFSPLADLVAADVQTGATGVQISAGLANAGFATGAVLGAQLALRVRQRALFLGAALLFTIGSVAAAASSDVVVLTIGRTAQGLASGLMLVSALPLLLTRFEARRLPVSAMVVNVGLFGASALGPLVGGLTADHWSWRGLLVAEAVLGAAAFAVAFVGFESFEPPDPDRKVDVAALGLVLLSTVATFTATSLLTGSSFVSWPVLAPLVVGLAALVVLVLVESRQDDALIPVGSLSTQLPVTGTLAAMVGGAVFVAAVELLQTQLTQGAGRSPTSAAVLFWPAAAGALVTAVVLRLLFTTRWMPVLVDVGLALLAAGSALLLLLADGGPSWLVLLTTLLLGLGAGAAVSPGLFLVGLGLPSDQVGRAFGMVQLLRSTATYAVAPVLLHVAMSTVGSSHPASGYRTAAIALVALAGVGLLAAIVVPAVSGARLRAPDLEAWLDGGQGLPSPTTAVHLRSGVEDDEAEPLLPKP